MGNDKGLLLAQAQLNLTVGDINGNADKIIAAAKLSHEKLVADILAVPEQAILGYPAEDLILRTEVISLCQQALQRITRDIPKELCLIVGYPRQHDKGNSGTSVTNHLEVLLGGKSIASYAKQLLPTYQVFDEHRLFAAGTESCCFTLPNSSIKFGLVICEDLWLDDPVAKCHAAGAQHIISINASPYSMLQPQKRLEVVARRAREHSIPISYVNCCGGQDELVFDGYSFVCDAQGDIIQLASPLTEELSLTEITTNENGKVAVASRGSWKSSWKLDDASQTKRVSTKPLDKISEVYEVLKHGLRDYALKNGISQCVIGLSGGIDSAVAVCLASDALGPDKVTAVAMPSKYTAAMSNDDAAELSKNLGINYKKLALEELINSVHKSLDPLVDMSEPTSIVSQNIQPRLRAIILMALANQNNALLIATSNKSESSVGYSTLYGDMAGGFAPLKDVFKNTVYQLAEYRNSIQEVIPQRIIQRPPSAELYEGQEDADNLPAYDVLDVILKSYIEEGLEHDAIIAQNTSLTSSLVNKVINLVDAAEYKRRQMAPGTRISEHGFGKDRRYPITNRFNKMRGDRMQADKTQT
ncbi:MAG: NAD+ synthase [Candidatus Portiera sp.]|nr:NAD+ synthase [Portiera sp.]